jgi:hypothetical protein
LKWRLKYDLDNIEDWEGPTFLKDYFPHGTTGFDKEGSPIIIIAYGGIDLWGLLHSATRHDIVKRTIKLLEGFMKIAYEKSLTHGAEARKFVVIFDMEGFSMRQYAYRPAAELAINIFQMYSNNYPEILKCCYVINGKHMFKYFSSTRAQNISLNSSKNILVRFQHCSKIPRRIYNLKDTDLQ